MFITCHLGHTVDAVNVAIDGSDFIEECVQGVAVFSRHALIGAVLVVEGMCRLGLSVALRAQLSEFAHGAVLLLWA